ncbi:hypothetical protein [Vibrio superstes]|uniref:Uncharacterized protein n=1 Tax=Vibrio superstes NBRC 103154 TaxID=1219062 RepID=A0A511QXH9_9VIBR|nr:hypothetical protein [Vibrio superstes]GEM81232.1 hypothetical protein VSU01S_34770 [Vibrio superstes NBRC 103154]
MSNTQSIPSQATLSISSLTMIATYASLYIAQIALFWTAFEKFSGAPEWLTEMLASSPFAPLTGFGWIMIGALELLVLAFVVLSLVKKEFLGHNNGLFLKAAISIGMVALATMAMGTSFANDFASKASFIYYLGAQVVMYLIADRQSQ